MAPLPRFRDYESVKAYLFALKARGVKVGLERMRLLAAILGNPERRLPVVHVAGTNGKGSTTAMIEAICRGAGLRTGLYTSPHLVHQAERIQVDRVPIAEAGIVAGVNAIHAAIEQAGGLPPEDFPSFFEFMTAMAFLEFSRRSVDVAVIEVGLGGRLDATNVVQPKVTAITSIGLDHCEILGDTFAAIAGEKAGIIKPGCPVVMGRVPPEAEEVIRRVAEKQGAPLVCVRSTFGEGESGYPSTNLEGTYQRWNAGTALLVGRILAATFPVTEEGMRASLEGVSWAGRWQRVRVRGGGLLILDASHNPEGAIGLEENLRRLEASEGRKPVVIAGTLGAFRAQALIPVAAKYAAELHLVVPAQERASDHSVLEAAIPFGSSLRVHRATVADLFPAPGECRLCTPGQTVVVTGSIYLLGEILQRLSQPGLSGQERLQDW